MMLHNRIEADMFFVQELLAPKLADILHTIVCAVDSPASLHETLKALAPMHLKKGVSATHLPAFGRSLVSTVEEILDGRFTTEMRAAWEWLWAWLSQSMASSLEEAVSKQPPHTFFLLEVYAPFVGSGQR